MNVKFIKKKRFLLDFIYQNERKKLEKIRNIEYNIFIRQLKVTDCT